MPGMKWSNVVSLVHGWINLRGIPKAVLLHCGGNDIGDVPCGALFHQMKFTITILSRMLPGCSVIWWSILPRRSWRYSNNDRAMEITRKRINRGIRSYILKYGGCVDKYPDFDDRHPCLFLDDGVHLSFIRNDIFLNQLQSAFETFIKYPYCFVFPWLITEYFALMNQLCWIENFVVGGYYGFELSWVNFVADYHSHPLTRMIIWRNLLDTYAAMDHPAAICDISYLLTDMTALQ
jgi:hypothetical protein